MKSAEIRKKFLKYFAERGHEVVPSALLIPNNDPTLLFINAGMVQFKEVFLGLEERSYTKATSVQRCMRANDLENVGYTARHHTFFEMLGNFSFGDYFKREAIQYAWEFLTEELKIPKEKLWVTVFEDDDEAADIWINEIKVDPKKLVRCGKEDNFWAMGDMGPCGPCSEVFYDHGPSVAGGPPGSPEQDGDRYVEVWNLVFMQYDRSASGELSHLPKPSIDTGMGLERLAAVLQGVHHNYDTDIFRPIIIATAKLAGMDDLQHVSLKVIADHIRAATFLIVDGIIPANEGRGYVLRRVIRRAIRHGTQLGLHDPFFYTLVAVVVQEMGEAYPELIKSQAVVEKVLLQEEEQFSRTLEQGLKIFEQDIAALSDDIIPGTTIFKLYDTYGFPVDLIGDIARERGLQLDMVGFEIFMAKQREQSKAASHFIADFPVSGVLDITTDFSGYEKFVHLAKVIKILSDGKEVDVLQPGDSAIVILDRTPFYAESGGQVGDTGQLAFSKGLFKVLDTQKKGKAFLHYGVLEKGELHINTEVDAQVDVKKRRATMRNHSATHLLHAALRQILGEHVLQKGSLVEPKRLRFDFTHYEAITPEQIRTIEHLVNQEIRENYKADTRIMSPEEAIQEGAVALFGEKYGDSIRVLSFGDFSKEVCGGTHVARTGDVGFFKIISEASIAAGIRRIEAVTGEVALDWLNVLESQMNNITGYVKGSRDNVADKVQQTIERNRQLEKQVEQLKARLASSVGTDLASQAKDVAGIKVLAAKLEGVESKTLRSTLDHLKDKLGSCVIVLVSVEDGRINVIAGISKDCIGKVPAPREFVVSLCGRGGGRKDMAQGGGEYPADLDERLAKIADMVEEALTVAK